MLRVMILALTLLVACDDPPCRPQGPENVALPEDPRPPPTTGPGEPPDSTAAPDDEGYGRNREGEVCRCRLGESGCTSDPDGADGEEGGARPPPTVDAGPAPGEPQGICGATFWGCADIRGCSGSTSTWSIVDEPICPRAYGGAETRGVAAGIMAGMAEEWIEGRRGCLVHGLNAHDAPIGSLSRCGMYPQSPLPAPN